MGLFGSKVKHPLAGLTPRDVRRGTTVELVDVDPAFVEQVRATYPKVPRLGHEAPIALVLDGSEIIAYSDDQRVGTLKPEAFAWYVSDMNTLRLRKQYGRTVVYIKPEGAKSPHAVALNWGENAFEGGLL